MQWAALETGRFSECRKSRKSSVGATVSSKTTPKMPTSEVDQGSDSAIRIATISALFAQAAGLRHSGSAGLTGDVMVSALTR
jgi:hypothetical protein